ncbi:hypothetical protein FOA52_008492 [Chlamydomonas sp. UWO 241]|nr:hypothetical protein FOA52_008491 [Chlamydomonas sp. UWO 241]KAG1653189.1 hypothetical protein FOA52_008492 [Chlamydomonas sp. UWO 241]
MEQAVPGAALFVDVGANIGSISLAVAAHGHTVVAFEGMPRNADMLHSSLCANPDLMPRVTLVAVGLGASPAKCWMFTDLINRGNGASDCHSATREAAALLLKATRTVYAYEGEMQVQRLDSFIDSAVRVLKVDVEGLESLVLPGASSLLARRTVWFLILEFNVERLSISMAPRLPTNLIDELIGYG